MEGVLAMHRLLISMKELCRNNELDLTYNEFIILLALKNKKRYVGSINTETLMDKGLIVRTLASLIKKGVVAKESEAGGSRYDFTEGGKNCLGIMERDRDDFTDSLFEEEEIAEAERMRKYIIDYEKRVRSYTFGSTEG